MSRHQPLSKKDTGEPIAVRDLRSLGANANGNAANENEDGNSSENIAQMPLSPGQKLKQARERQGFSIAEVAAQLRLSNDCIASLERDAFDCLPGTTFTRGYIRSYANLVKANADELIDLFDDSFKVEEEAAETESIRLSNGKTKFQPWLSYSIALVFVVLAASWWWLRGDDAGVEVIESVEVQANTGELIVETMDVTEESTAIEAAVAPAEVTTEPEAGVTLEESVVENTAVADESVPVLDDDFQLAVADNHNLNVESGEVEAAITVNAAVATDQLSISFVEDCWVQIYDVNGERVHADLERANDTLQVVGIAPLKVKFGNWRAVSDIQFNDKQIPIPQSQRGDVVQFTIAP